MSRDRRAARARRLRRERVNAAKAAQVWRVLVEPRVPTLPVDGDRRQIALVRARSARAAGAALARELPADAWLELRVLGLAP